MLNIDLKYYTKWKEDLITDIRYFDYRDDLDWNGGEFPEIPSRPIRVIHPDTGCVLTQSICDLENIKNQFLKIQDKCKCILEIGVDCNETPTEMTSTRIFLDNKNDDTIYIGLDLNDKSYLNNESKNVFTLQNDSSDIKTVIDFIKSKGVDKIDFLFIDGWHSINQVMREWEYTKWISNHAIIGFHDTSVHPGPHSFLKNLNKEKWNVIENSCSFYNNDYGVGFAWKKEGVARYTDVALLLQGPIDNKERLDFMDSIEYYKSLFSEIIITTYTEELAEDWRFQKFCEENGIKLVHQTSNIQNVINDNGVYYQTYTTLNGLKHVSKKYVLKHRIDERYSNLESLIDKFLIDDIKYVTGGTVFGQKVYHEFHGADHLVICRTNKLIKTMQFTIDQLTNGILDGEGPEIIYVKNFIRANGEEPISERHDELMRKYLDFLPDKYMEPFIIRANNYNQIWRTAAELGERRNAYETIDDMINSEEVVLNQFYQ